MTRKSRSARQKLPSRHPTSVPLSAYSGIGINKLREITNERGCNFVLFVGTKRLIKRRLLDAYLEKRDTL